MAFLPTLIEENRIEKSNQLKLLDESLKLSSEEKEKLSSLENDYDKKYNWFCLSLSNYSDDKIENIKSKKEDELKALKNSKHSSKSRFERLSTQIKIDTVQNMISKCNSVLKKHNKK